MLLQLFMSNASFPEIMRQIALLIPALLLSFTIHEFFHGFAALVLGDNTAKWDGRLTLNPIPHIDPTGLIMILVVGFGWAKPVMVNPYNLRNPKRDMAIIALAGPVSNFVTAFFALFFAMFLMATGSMIGVGVAGYIILFFVVLFNVNVMLGTFNLIPIPPLDGSKILGSFLPHHLYWRYMTFRYWFVVLLILLMGPMIGLDIGLGLILNPAMDVVWNGYTFIIARFLGLFF